MRSKSGSMAGSGEGRGSGLMRLRDRIMFDRQTFQRLDKKKRWLFIWDYYKIPIISVVLILTVGAIILTGLGRQEADLYVVMVNANKEIDNSVIPELLAENGIDLKDRKIDFETDYTLKYDDITETDVQTVEVLAVRFGIGDLDVFAADKAVFESYAEKDAFIDLSLFISEDDLKSYEADLYRYTNSDGKEIVGGVWLREGSPLHKAGLYHDDVLVGVAALAQNLDNALHLVRQLITAR